MKKNDFNFENEIQIANIDMLLPHHERKTLFLVNKDLDILEVSKMMEDDNVKLIKEYLDNKKISKTTDKLISTWEVKFGKEYFSSFTIISPFVLMQLKD